MNREQLFLGRQPILDRSETIIGFELLFRSADCLSANVTDYFQASTSVIFTTISDFGIEEVLGPHKGFFNVDAGVLMSEMIELLPRNQVVIELLENIEITPEIIERCGELKRKGFSLALDDHLYGQAWEPLYEIVDIIRSICWPLQRQSCRKPSKGSDVGRCSCWQKRSKPWSSIANANSSALNFSRTS